MREARPEARGTLTERVLAKAVPLEGQREDLPAGDVDHAAEGHLWEEEVDVHTHGVVAEVGPERQTARQPTARAAAESTEVPFEVPSRTLDSRHVSHHRVGQAGHRHVAQDGVVVEEPRPHLEGGLGHEEGLHTGHAELAS